MTTHNPHTPFLTLLTDGQEYTAPSIAADAETVKLQAANAEASSCGNWTLIAVPLPVALAAPDLLAALEGCADALHEAGKDFAIYNPLAARPNLYELHEQQARAAIAKSKGQP